MAGSLSRPARGRHSTPPGGGGRGEPPSPGQGLTSPTQSPVSSLVRSSAPPPPPPPPEAGRTASFQNSNLHAWSCDRPHPGLRAPCWPTGPARSITWVSATHPARPRLDPLQTPCSLPSQGLPLLDSPDLPCSPPSDTQHALRAGATWPGLGLTPPRAQCPQRLFHAKAWAQPIRITDPCLLYSFDLQMGTFYASPHLELRCGPFLEW